MVKKIGAIFLALIICLSVVVLPVSAAGFDSSYALESGKKLAFKIETDKEYYSAGETVNVNIYVKADAETQFAGGAFTLACNSAAFDKTAAENLKTALPTKFVLSSAWQSYYKTGTNIQCSWLAAAVINKIAGNNTAEENALYDQYLKVTIAKNSSGSHEYASSNAYGITGAELSTEEPFITIPLKLRDDLADGTKIDIAITSGTPASTSAGATQYKYYAEPGSGAVPATLTQAEYDLTPANTSATVGAAAKSILVYSKAQIRFKGITATSPKADYEGTFDVRTVAKISQADFLATFGSEDAAKNATTGITDFGFVYAAKSKVADFNIDTAKAVAMGTASDANYVKKSVTYMQHTDGSDYVFTCLIKDIADADKTDGVNCLAFVKYGETGEYIFFDAAASVDYTALYDQYMPAA